MAHASLANLNDCIMPCKKQLRNAQEWRKVSPHAVGYYRLITKLKESRHEPQQEQIRILDNHLHHLPHRSLHRSILHQNR